LEREWRSALGEDVYAGLAHALEQLQEVLEARVSLRR
jgi:hypothetical protein